MRSYMTGGLLLGLALAGAAGAAEVFWEDFAELARWTSRGTAGWELADVEAAAEGDPTRVLRLARPAPLPEGVRRPGDYQLISGRVWRDVVYDVQVRSLRPATLLGRDVVVIFGFQDYQHFYYAHLSNDSNGTVHNVIMKVNGDDPDPARQRYRINVEDKPEPRLTDGWHQVRIDHRADGRIKVYMGDMIEPLMTANDTDYAQGQVGVTSFDDTAEFANVRVIGRVVAPGE